MSSDEGGLSVTTMAIVVYVACNISRKGQLQALPFTAQMLLFAFRCRYIPTADDVGRRVGARVSFPGSFVEVLAWHPEAVQLDADAAAVLATIAHDRNATFPIKARTRGAGRDWRCVRVLGETGPE